MSHKNKSTYKQLFSTSLLKLVSIISLSMFLFSCATHQQKAPGNSYRVNIGDTHLSKLISSSVNKRSSELGGFRLLHNGMEALASIIYLTNTAQASIDLQYWSLHQDKTGQLVIHHLLKAADRGIRVRLLLDDFVARGGNSNLFTLAKHPNIDVKLYNPISRRKWLRGLSMLTRFKRVNRRMHNKAFIVDNSVAIVGGRNIGDAYYIAKQNYLYRDLDVMTIGSSARKVSDSFDAYWNAKWAVRIEKLNKRLFLPIGYKNKRKQLANKARLFMSGEYWKALSKINVSRAFLNPDQYFVWARYKVLFDPPNKIKGIKKSNRRFLEHIMATHMANATDNVKLITPYFIPQRFGLKWIKQLSKKGVSVSVLTNSFAANDFSLSHGGYQRYRKRLLKNGVKLYEFKRSALKKERAGIYWFKNKPVARLHAKSIIIDNRYIYVGSVNLTPRSRYLNTETSILIDSTQLAKQMDKTFTELAKQKNSYQLSLKKVVSIDDEGEQQEGYDISWKSNGKHNTNHEPEVSVFKHLTISILSLFPIEDLM